MIDQPNPYVTSETETGVPVGEDGMPRGLRRIWFWLFMGRVVPLAFVGLATIGLLIYVYYEAMYSGI